MATVYRAGTFVKYTSVNENGVSVTRGAWLATDSDGTTANKADLKAIKYPSDYANAPGPCTVVVPAVSQGTTDGTWALPTNAPYTGP